MKIIDLTHALENGSSVFPGDPACIIETAHHYENGYFVSNISMGSHTGTHVDTPAHKLEGARSLTDFPLETFCAENAAVLDCRGVTGEIDAAFLNAHREELRGCEAVLLLTGWSSHWGGMGFFSGYTGLNEDAAEALKEMGIRMVALESPSVNAVRHESVHTALLSREIIIVEAVCGMEELLGKRFRFFAMPLKLSGRDGSPVRAFAVVE